MLSSVIFLALVVLLPTLGIFTLSRIRELENTQQRLLQSRRRQRALLAEAARLQQKRENIELVAKTAQNLAGTILDDGSKAAREVHKEIANVPFDILESIPATRDSTKVVRGVHDAIADVSYASVGLFGKLVKGRRDDKPNSPQPSNGPSEPALANPPPNDPSKD